VARLLSHAPPPARLGSSIDHPQPARRRVDRDQHRPCEVRPLEA